MPDRAKSQGVWQLGHPPGRSPLHPGCGLEHAWGMRLQQVSRLVMRAKLWQLDDFGVVGMSGQVSSSGTLWCHVVGHSMAGAIACTNALVLHGRAVGGMLSSVARHRPAAHDSLSMTTCNEAPTEQLRSSESSCSLKHLWAGPDLPHHASCTVHACPTYSQLSRGHSAPATVGLGMAASRRLSVWEWVASTACTACTGPARYARLPASHRLSSGSPAGTQRPCGMLCNTLIRCA